MELKTPYTPACLSQAEQKMSIPIYQRLFVWGRQQIWQLLSDLWRMYEQGKNAPYYVGVITVHNNNGCWEIVDGQQRLTFINLLGCGFVRMFKEDEKVLEWNDFVGKNLIEYQGRPDDRKDMLAYASGNGEVKNLNFREFKDVFEDFFYAKKNDGGDMRAFARYCFAKFSFLVNFLPDDYGPFDLNLYFEKMNATGIQLTPVEMVKGRWFSRYAETWNECLNFDKKFDKVVEEANSTALGLVSLNDLLSESREHDDCFAEPEARTGMERMDRLVMRDEVFLLHVLRICNGKDVSLIYKHLLATFDRWMPETPNEKYIEELVKYRRWIDENIIYLENVGGEFDYSFRQDACKEIDAFTNEDLNSRKMRQFQSMLYVSGGDDQLWVLEAYLERNGCAISYDWLRNKDNKRRILPQEELMTYHSIGRYWFWRLDYELWDHICCHNKTKPAIDSLISEEDKEIISKFKFRRNVSIEHLHPQSAEDESWGRRDDPTAEMHKFGNLAMISSVSNSSQSDDGVSTKFGRVQDWLSLDSGKYSSLESIKLLLMFRFSEQNGKCWTTDLSRRHQSEMLNFLSTCIRKIDEGFMK